MRRSPLPLPLLLAAATAAVVLHAAPASPAHSPAATPVRNDPLTRIYRGDDGGILYLRRHQGSVYGFGEHPGSGYAYVLTATVSGDRLNGSWWDVPKGTRREQGTLRLRWTQNGARLTRVAGDDLGPDTFTALAPTGIPWPNRQVAGFQGRTRGNLNGVFEGDDASRHYVRNRGDDVVWVAEHGSQPGERPKWATVFVGKLSANGTGISGTSVDVPKGIERKTSSFGAALISGRRDLALSQPNSRRTKSLAPDYAIDWVGFADAIETRLNGNVVGYAYAIARDGAFMRMGAGGLRRLAIDGGARSFTVDTQAQTASTAKTINATALIMALRDRGYSVNTRIASFLPKCLKQGPGVATLTFAQILSHTSGLPRVACNGGSPYDCLVRMLKEGRTQPRTRIYNTHAYDLVRWLVPLVAETAGWKQQFERLDCKNTGGVLNRKVSERFARYVREKVLTPVGAKAFFFPSGDFSLNYDFADRTKKGEAPRTDFFERAGSGKLTMSVTNYIRFLSALEQGKILPASTVRSMYGSSSTDRLGFDNVWAGAVSGGYPWKNGGCPDFENRGRGCATAAMVFPSGIVAYVATNSTNNGYTGSIQGVLAQSFDAALR